MPYGWGFTTTQPRALFNTKTNVYLNVQCKHFNPNNNCVPFDNTLGPMQCAIEPRVEMLKLSARYNTCHM
jgi:hypothetical protein